MKNVDLMFGVPFYKGKIDPNRYNKSKIIETFHHNYKIDPKRNKWSILTDVHNLNGDYDNPSFKEVDDETKRLLSNLYGERLDDFFTSYLGKPSSYKFHVINYTCMMSNQYMVEHTHPCDFSAVHYLKFNKNIHLPTYYVNPLTWGFYSDRVFTTKWKEVTKNGEVENSFMHGFFSLPIEEDDFVVTPGPLRHFVPSSDFDELRMTIVVNIKFVD